MLSVVYQPAIFHLGDFHNSLSTLVLSNSNLLCNIPIHVVLHILIAMLKKRKY
jgi:hypothetical protein